jgi:N-formylglutamate amidohydrolase
VVAYFDLVVPEHAATPVLVEIPHAGLAIPDLVRDQIAAPVDAVVRDSDIYVDKLYRRVPERGASLLTATISRYVVDLNRAPTDVDRETVPDHPSPRTMQPRGVVWRMTTGGQRALTRPLRYRELRERLDTFHGPYHDALETRLTSLRARFGFAILVAAHSMPSVGRGGSIDSGARRADVVPGTRGRSTAHPRVIDAIDAYFRTAGLTVSHDDPYRGGWTTGHYGRPADDWHAVQIELNRALYVDEATGRPRERDFERLEGILLDLVTELGRLPLRRPGS